MSRAVVNFVNPIQNREEGATSFSHEISTKVKISPQNFLTFTLNLFATLV